MYVEGNPIAYADFTGHASIGGFFKKVGNAIYSAGAGLVSAGKYLVDKAVSGIKNIASGIKNTVLSGSWLNQQWDDSKEWITDKLIILGASLAGYYAGYFAAYVLFPSLMLVIGVMGLGLVGGIVFVAVASIIIGAVVGAAAGAIVGALLAEASNSIFNTNHNWKEYAAKGAGAGTISGAFGGLAASANRFLRYGVGIIKK
jgi:hypothetical protein